MLLRHVAQLPFEECLTLSGARKLTTGADADTHEPFAPRAPSVALDGPFWYVLATPCERLTSSFRIAPWAMGTPQRMRKYPQDMAARRSVPGDMGVDGGGRFTSELTDADPDEVAIGMRVRMTFRRMLTADGVHNYFWKATPIR